MNYQSQKQKGSGSFKKRKNKSLKQPIYKKKEPVRTKTAINMAD
jgi:hypothetical protein